MKIAISTIVDYNNYGNRLQNYALQEILLELGHEVETIKNITYRKPSMSKRMLKIIKNGNLIKKVNSKLFPKNSTKKNIEMYNKIRKEKFQKFSKKFILETVSSIDDTMTDFSKIDYFDCYVIGSDQVWNYNFPRFSSLDFVNYSKKPKLSYAASFGVDKISDEYYPIYLNGLNELQYISVREDAGKKIVEGITHRKDVQVVVDPTLLVKEEVWSKLIKNSPKYQHRYILTYFLDKPNEYTSQYIFNFSKKNNLEIKNLLDINELELWTADPVEFVNLFSQAEAIFTDSFHACVFSIIFEKYFEIFDRNYDGPSMNSRIETLLKDFKLENRWHKNGNTPNGFINYGEVKKLLERKRTESLTFLESSLNSIDRNLQ